MKSKIEYGKHEYCEETFIKKIEIFIYKMEYEIYLMCNILGLVAIILIFMYHCLGINDDKRKEAYQGAAPAELKKEKIE